MVCCQQRGVEVGAFKERGKAATLFTCTFCESDVIQQYTDWVTYRVKGSTAKVTCPA